MKSTGSNGLGTPYRPDGFGREDGDLSLLARSVETMASLPVRSTGDRASVGGFSLHSKRCPSPTPPFQVEHNEPLDRDGAI